MRHVLAFLLVAVLLVPGAAGAAGMLATYEVDAAGITILRIQARIVLTDRGYSLTTRSRTVGLAGVLSRGDRTATAEGDWQGQAARPRQYRVEGLWRGENSVVRIDYPGGQPRLLQLHPREEEREPVPAALQQNSIDGMAALAQLARVVAETGRCDGRAAIYDGRRRSDLASRTLGQQPVRASGSVPGGQALVCAFESRMVAGLRRTEDPERARRPREHQALILPARDGWPPMALQVDMSTAWFGTLRANLVAVQRLPEDVAEQRR